MSIFDFLKSDKEGALNRDNSRLASDLSSATTELISLKTRLAKTDNAKELALLNQAEGHEEKVRAFRREAQELRDEIFRLERQVEIANREIEAIESEMEADVDAAIVKHTRGIRAELEKEYKDKFKEQCKENKTLTTELASVKGKYEGSLLIVKARTEDNATLRAMLLKVTPDISVKVAPTDNNVTVNR